MNSGTTAYRDFAGSEQFRSQETRHSPFPSLYLPPPSPARSGGCGWWPPPPSPALFHDTGKIYLNNKSIEQTPIHLRSKEGLGYLPQQRSVFDMSVYDNVLGVAQISIKGVEEQKAITEKLLDEFNLQHLRTLNASVLSGGEIRRLMMARVMITSPKIVLLDEPLAALDPLVIQDIQKYILKIQSC